MQFAAIVVLLVCAVALWGLCTAPSWDDVERENREAGEDWRRRQDAEIMQAAIENRRARPLPPPPHKYLRF